MAKLIYAHPGDNIAGTYSTLVPTNPDPAYPVTNLHDLNPAKPFRFTAKTANQNIVWDFGTDKTIDLVAIIHHNLDFALETRIQANATDVWTSPSLNQVLTVPIDDLDGFPTNIWADLTGIGTRTFRYWRIVVVGVNGENPAFGEILLYTTKRILNVDILFPVEEGTLRPIIEHQTDYGVSTVYDLGVKIRRFNAKCNAIRPDRFLPIRKWWDAAHGRTSPFLVVADYEAEDVYQAMMMRWQEQERIDSHTFPGMTEVQLSFVELSRGLYL